MIRVLVVAAVFAGIGLPLGANAQEFPRWTSFCEGVEHTAGAALGDVDGDGDLDVVFANGRHLAEPDWVYSNDGRGTFYGKRRLESQPDRSYGIALGDLDDNGTLDAVVANDAGDRSVVYSNDGSGAFLPIAGLGSGTLSEARRAVALSDLDSDGDLDVVLVGSGQDHVYLNEAAGRRWTSVPLGPETARGLAVVVGDLDLDGDADLAIAYRAPGRTVVYENDGNASFTAGQILSEGVSDPTGLALGDLDGDRILDLVIVNWRKTHSLYLGDGRGGLVEHEVFGTEMDQAWSVALGDFDLDGDFDVLVGAANLTDWYDDFEDDGVPDRFGSQAYSVPSRIYLNDGGSLVPGAAVSSGNDNTRPVAVGDVDGDGDLDILIGNDCQPSSIFFNSVRRPGRQR